MSFISPALISRIFQALGRNKGSRAVLLLRQHCFDHQPTSDNELMSLVAKMADQCLVESDLERAEDHYKLGLALYEACFRDSSVEALRCVTGLLTIYQEQHRVAELISTADQLEKISAEVHTKHSVPKVRAV